MCLTLEEIISHRDRLRREIVERQCLLAAFDVLHGYMAGGESRNSVELGSLVSTLATALPDSPLSERIAALPQAAPMALPRPAPEPPYVHPELNVLFEGGASNVQFVRWAMARMTEDFSLKDIKALLTREGYPMPGAQISVVLTRMRNGGEIEQIARSHGPIPARFRKPPSAIATNPAPVTNEMEAETVSIALAQG